MLKSHSETRDWVTVVHIADISQLFFYEFVPFPFLFPSAVLIVVVCKATFTIWREETKLFLQRVVTGRPPDVTPL